MTANDTLNGAFVLSVQEQREHFIREDGSSYTRADIFVKLFVTFRDKMLRTLKGPKLSVYLCLALHCGEDMHAWPSIKTVAEETGYSEQAVKASLKELAKLGLVEIAARYLDDGSQSSNNYGIKGFITMGEGGGKSVYPAPVSQKYPPQGYEIPPKEEPLEEEPSEDMADADAPPPIPSPGEMLGRKDKDRVRRDAETYFSHVTGLMITEGMTSRAKGQLWYAPLREICGLGHWDYRRIHELIDAACARLRKADCTISDPNSIIKTARAVGAERKRGVMPPQQEPVASKRYF